MTGDDMKAIRQRLGLSTIQFGRAIGYRGNDNSVSVIIRRYQRGERDIPAWIARLVAMFDRHGVPQDWLPRAD